MKGQRAAPAPREEDAAVGRAVSVFLFCVSLALHPFFSTAHAQQLPADEIQFDINTYLDNFMVAIAYPSMSLTRRITRSTSLTGRYLVDAISAASMKSRFQVDGITSATPGTHGGGDDTPDEVRHEGGLGFSQSVRDGIISLNGLYSTEHDYSSATLTGQAVWPFAKKNTVLQAGATKSWDRIFPQTRLWKREKDVLSLDAGLTQILSKTMLAQINLTLTASSGYLSNPYQVISVIQSDTLAVYEPVHPDDRSRYAAGARMKFKAGPASSFQPGYRFYRDSWEITSHTIDFFYQWYNKKRTILFGTGTRHYLQSRAFFFKPEYTERERYMTVDSKLNSAYSNELQFDVHYSGERFKNTALLRRLLHDEKSDLHTIIKLYHRHTASPDWHSRRKDLLAVILSVGYRYRW